MKGGSCSSTVLASLILHRYNCYNFSVGFCKAIICLDINLAISYQDNICITYSTQCPHNLYVLSLPKAQHINYCFSAAITALITTQFHCGKASLAKKNLTIIKFVQFPKNTWSEIATLNLYSDDNYKTIKNKNMLVMLASTKTMLFDVSKHHVTKPR